MCALTFLGICVKARPYSMVVGKVETGCPLLVSHHVAPRTGGCHRRLVTGTVAVHMLLVVVIQPPCRCSDSPRVQHSPPFIKRSYSNYYDEIIFLKVKCNCSELIHKILTLMGNILNF